MKLFKLSYDIISFYNDKKDYEIKNLKSVGYSKFKCHVCHDMVRLETYICPDDKRCFSYGKITVGCSCGNF